MRIEEKERLWMFFKWNLFHLSFPNVQHGILLKPRNTREKGVGIEIYTKFSETG